MQSLRFITLLRRLWDFIVQPPALLMLNGDAERKYQQLLLSRLTAVLILLSPILAVLSNVVIGDTPLLQDGAVLISIAISTILMTARILNQRGKVMTAARIIAAGLSFCIVAGALYLWTPGWSNSTFFALILPLIFGTAFFSVFELGLMAVANMSAVLIAVWIHPQIIVTDVLDVLLFVVVAAVLVALFNRYHGMVEAERRAELETERARLRFILDHMPVMIDALDQDLHMALWNKEAERVTGYSLDEMRAHPKPLKLLYSAEELAGLSLQWQALKPDFRNWEMNLTCKDGTERIIAWSSLADLHPIPGWRDWAVGIDVTERRLAERHLRESEARLRSILDNMPMLLDAFDDQGRVVFWNKECERVTGYSAEEIMAYDQPLLQLYSAAEYERMTRRNPLTGVNLSDWELTLTCKDGSTRTISWSSIAGTHPVAGWAFWGVGVDVTERRQAEQRLRENEERMRFVLRHSPSILFMIDAKGIFTLSEGSALAALGLEPGQVVGYSAFEMLGNEADDGSVLRKALAGERGHYVMRVRDHYWDNIMEPILGTDGTVTGVIGTSIDITRRMALEEQTKILEREQMRVEVLRQIISDVTHDLQTPITGIKTIAYLLNHHENDAERQQQWIKTIDALADRLGHLVADMLTLSNLDTQPALGPEFVPVDVRKLCTELMVEINPMAEAQGLRLEARLDDEPVMVNGSELQIGRVVQNLVSNAIHYTPEGGLVELVARGDNDRVIIEVRDTGIGIPEEARQRIFERFYRVDPARNTATGGSGLGLSIVQKIVEAHKGSIAVRSEPGKGSVFTVEFPAAKQA